MESVHHLSVSSLPASGGAGESMSEVSDHDVTLVSLVVHSSKLCSLRGSGLSFPVSPLNVHSASEVFYVSRVLESVLASNVCVAAM